jgi:transcriptional regulator with XRE-family HTH domain
MEGYKRTLLCDMVPGSPSAGRDVAERQDGVGRRILEIRQARGFSLRALAAKSGVSINAISRIERGDSSPTVSSLQRLASALDLRLVDFFRAEPERSMVLVRKGARRKSRTGGVVIESLGAGLRGQSLGPFLMKLEPGASAGEEPVRHEGEEFVHCLEGEAEYLVGSERHRLRAGDSLLFHADRPHLCRHVSGVRARLLIVIAAAAGDMQATQQRHLMIAGG